MKRKVSYLIILTSFVLAIFLFPSTASAADIVKTGTTGADGNLTWTLDSEGVLTISGTGDMGEYYWTIPWADERGTLTKVIIEEGVTNVGKHAFEYEDNLTTVELPDTVTTVEAGAFLGCDNLTDIKLPDNLVTIGDSAFQYCESLTRMEFPASLNKIDEAAFQGCINLKTVLFYDDVEDMFNGAFYVCHDELTFYGLKRGNISDFAEYNDIGFKLITEIKLTGAYLDRTLGTSYATITWKPVALTDGYRLYKYDAKSKTYVKVKDLAVETTSYKLTGLSSGSVYQYKVCSFMKVAGKEYASEGSVVKFRTMTSTAAINSRNNLVSNGFAAAIKTVTKTYSGLEGYTIRNYGHYAASVSDISQFKDDKGNYCVAYSNVKSTYIFIRAYDKNMNQVYYRKIAQLYPLLGGVACDENGNFYVVWGKTDTKDSPGAVTMAVSKYTKAGKLVKTLKIKTTSQGSTKDPFRSGNCDIALNDGLLVCNYGRGMYNGHQSNGTIQVLTDTMTQVNTYYNYVSHSFDQRVLFDKEGIAWFVNHGDAYPRGFGVETYSEAKIAEYEPFHFYAAESALNNMFVLNETNANLGGVVETSSGLVLVGSSVKSMQKSGYGSQKKNLFIMYADPDKVMLDGVSRSGICLGESKTDKGVKWLTGYTGYNVENPQVVYTDDDRIVVLWETSKNGVYQNTYYMILSANGKKLQKATKIKNVRLNANEEPIYKDGYVYWSTCADGYLTSNKMKIHRLNLSVLNFDKSTLAVKKLRVPSKTKNSVTLQWNKNANASGYYIYRYNTSTKAYKKIATVKASQLKYTVKKLKKKTNYTYAVQAYKKYNSTIYKGAYTKIKVKTK